MGKGSKKKSAGVRQEGIVKEKRLVTVEGKRKIKQKRAGFKKRSSSR